MIRRGKSQGWLTLKTEQLKRWAKWNEIAFDGAAIDNIEHKGLGLVATQASRGTSAESPLLTVPEHLILSKENVHLHAKVDEDLSSVLQAAGQFGNTSRGAILIFLLVQITHSCPEVKDEVGVSHDLTDYIKSLPMELLPTFWNDTEREELQGTSLAEALDSKIISLHHEFDTLREATIDIPWCQKLWWDEFRGLLEFDDWKQVDAMYRSRALEFPGIGDCMVPQIDVANHASGEYTAARYEKDVNGNAILLRRAGKKLFAGDEITITYGDEKGACEMIFSYGFLEENLETARSVLISLSVPDDDPLRPAKNALSSCAPGCLLTYDAQNHTYTWESDYIWIIVVNEEDGLHFQIAQTRDGERELHATWNDETLDDLSGLKQKLELHPLWNMFRLRAIVTLQGRVDSQLESMLDAEQHAKSNSMDSSVRNEPRTMARKLRQLETKMLEGIAEFFKSEMESLMNSQTVRQYLQGQNQNSDDNEEDFS